MSDQLPAHSRLGASGSYRWMNCSGSVNLPLPEGDGGDDSSEFSKRGTFAHDVGSKALVSGDDAWMHAHGPMYDEDDAVAVQVYLDAIRAEVRDLPGCTIMIEERHHLSEVHKDFFGTTDCTIIAEKQAQVWDYKHGVGIVVEAKRNTQLMQYAVGALYRLPQWKNDNYPVELNICQPRAFHADGPIRSWLTSVGELKEWLHNEWLPKAKATEGSTSLQPGPWCNKTFCPHRLTCPALNEMHARVVAITDEEILNMEDWELGLLGQELAILIGRRKVFEDEAFRRLRNGNPVPGWKIVPGKTDRVFKEEITDADGKTLSLKDEIFATLGDKAYQPPKMVTPAQAEKLPGGKAFVAKWAYKPVGSDTLAPDTDQRAGKKARNRNEVFAGKL